MHALDLVQNKNERDNHVSGELNTPGYGGVEHLTARIYSCKIAAPQTVCFYELRTIETLIYS